MKRSQAPSRVGVTSTTPSKGIVSNTKPSTSPISKKLKTEVKEEKGDIAMDINESSEKESSPDSSQIKSSSTGKVIRFSIHFLECEIPPSR